MRLQPEGCATQVAYLQPCLCLTGVTRGDRAVIIMWRYLEGPGSNRLSASDVLHRGAIWGDQTCEFLANPTPRTVSYSAFCGIYTNG